MMRSTETLRANVVRILGERKDTGVWPQTQSELAAGLGISRAALSKMLHAGDSTIRLDTVDKIAAVLRVPSWELIRTSDGSPPGDHPIEECARRLLDRAGVRFDG